MPFKNKEEQLATSKKGGLAIVKKRGKEHMSQNRKERATSFLNCKEEKENIWITCLKN